DVRRLLGGDEPDVRAVGGGGRGGGRNRGFHGFCPCRTGVDSPVPRGHSRGLANPEMLAVRGSPPENPHKNGRCVCGSAHTCVCGFKIGRPAPTVDARWPTSQVESAALSVGRTTWSEEGMTSWARETTLSIRGMTSCAGWTTSSVGGTALSLG